MTDLSSKGRTARLGGGTEIMPKVFTKHGLQEGWHQKPCRVPRCVPVYL
jgi:hypothetical protein